MREAIRFWRRRPLAALAVIASIGGAAAVATTTVAVAHAVLWRELPLPEPDRVVTVQPVAAAGRVMVWAQHYEIWKARQEVFDDLAAYQFDFSAVGIVLHEGVEEVTRLRVTANIFDVLGVRPAAGQLFTAHDAGAGQDDLVVLSHAAWTRVFGRDPSIVGRPIRVSYQHEPPTTRTVVGVAAPGLEIQGFLADGIDVFTLLPAGVPSDPRRAADWQVIGRLRPDVTPDLAQARMQDIVVDAARGGAPEPVGVRVTRLHEALYGHTRSFVRPLLATGLLIVLIGCASAGGTMLTVASRRARSVAIQQALGRPAGRIRRAFLLEGLGLGLLAGLVAWLGARVLMHTVSVLGPASVPRLADAHVGWLEAAVAGLLAAGSGLVIGSIPAYPVAGDALHALREGAGASLSKAALRYRQCLLGAQLALVLVLLVTAGLMLGTLRTLVTRPLGFTMDRVLVAELRVPTDLARDLDRSRLFLDRLVSAALAAPGQRMTAVAFDAPLDGGTGRAQVNVYPSEPGASGMRVASERVERGYFDVLGIPLLAGRDFPAGEHGQGMLVVSESFAREHFGGAAAAVGQFMRWGNPEWPPAEIIGVVGDARHTGLKQSITPMLYRPLVQSVSQPLPSMIRLVTREHDDVGRAAVDLRAALQGVDPRLSVRVAPLADRFRRDTAEERLLAIALAVLAASSLILSVLGIVALVGQLVTDRTRELAIRLVLGSSGGAIQRLVMRAMALPAMMGMAAGLLVAWWAVGLIRHFLFEVRPFDAVLWGIAVGVFIAATLLGAWWPARRALRVDPAQALRWE